jgi:hypothetical protein
MPSPFPGMDPYLEDPAIWPGVHAALLAAFFEQLGPMLRPKYAVRYEERVYVSGEEDPGFRTIIPDLRVIFREDTHRKALAAAGTIAEPVHVQLAEEEVHERSLHVIDVRDRSLVTVIELLSPTNKVLNSFGRESFLRKRREVRAGGAHWIEIDLLRDGVRTANAPNVPQSEYQAYLTRAGERRQADVWPISIRNRLPGIAVPLKGDDPDVPLDLQKAMSLAVERGSYDLDTDYDQDPVPPLAEEHRDWARELIKRWKAERSEA